MLKVRGGNEKRLFLCNSYFVVLAMRPSGQCAVCKVEKSRAQYDRHGLQRHLTDNDALVCLNCRDLGYSPADVTKYLCAGKHESGHRAFEAKHLQRWKEGSRQHVFCQSCIEMHRDA